MPYKKQIAYLLGGLLVGVILVALVTQPTKEELAQAMFEDTQAEYNYVHGLYEEKQLEADELKVKVDSTQTQLDSLESILYELGVGTPAYDYEWPLSVLIDSYGSNLDASVYVQACSKYPMEMCKIFVGIMVHESKLCTKFYLPAIEEDYHNCSGWKSLEIVTTHTPDEKGSWLQDFDSYQQYYDIVLPKFYSFYWQQNLKSAEDIVEKYVGKFSQNWINTVQATVTKL